MLMFHKKSKRHLLIVGILLMLVGGINFMSRPVHACCGDAEIAAAATEKQTGSLLAQWASQFEQWASQFKYLTDMIGWIKTFTKTFNDDMQRLGAGINAGQKAQAELDVRLAESMAQANADTAVAAVQSEIVAKNMTPPITNRQLCNTIYVTRGPAASRNWEMGIANSITSMVANRYRGPGMDGNGPQAAGDDRFFRCGGKDNKNPYASKIDGYPDKCVAKDPDLADADIHYKVLSGLLVLEKPHLKDVDNNGTPMKVFDPQTKEQNLFVAASNFCLNAAGKRPTPPYGKDLDSPEGMAAAAAFARGLALETTFVNQCARRVAKMTRPACSDSQQTDDPAIQAKCDSDIQTCTSFIAAGGTVTPDIDKFCQKGLTPLQLEYMANTLCTASQRYTDAAGAGASHASLMDSNNTCDLLVSTWRAQLANEEANLVEAFRALQNMGGAYAATAAQPSKRQSIKSPEAPFKKHDRDQARLETADKLLREKATKPAVEVVPMGVPFDADAISLPVAIEQ